MNRWKKKHLEVLYFYDERKETFISKFIAVRLINIQEVRTSTYKKNKMSKFCRLTVSSGHVAQEF